MKKICAILLSLVLVFSLVACGSSTDSDTADKEQSQGASDEDGSTSEGTTGTGTGASDDEQSSDASDEDGSESEETTGEAVTLRVGASPTPHAEILTFAKDILASEYNVNLEIIEYSDYVVPNTAVEEGEDDANYFQHTPYLETFNEDNGTHLVSVAKIHYEPFGLYSETVTDVADLPDGAVIAIPNDGSNEARALYLLEAEGLITLDHEAGFNATVLDITDNPKNITFQEVAAEMVARTLDDVDGAIVNGNYALEAGLDIADAIATEAADSDSAQTYANVIVVKEGNEDNEAVKALVEVLTSDAVRDYINDTYDGAVVPVF